MQQLVNTPAPSTTESLPAAPKGPVELDPRLFGLVAGGSPRNGWQAPTTAAALPVSSSPRNGW